MFTGLSKRISKRIGIRTLDDKLLFAFSTAIFLPILFDFITTVTRGNSSSYTFAIYIGTLILFFVQFSKIIRAKNIIALFGIYIFFLFNYILFPISQTYLSSNEFILVCIYFISIGVLFFTHIRDWSGLISMVNKYSVPAILIGLYILLSTNIVTGKGDEVLFTYMEFSYALLPFICAPFARYYETKNKLTLLVFLIGLFEILSYGCRGAVIFTILFVLLTILLNSKTNKFIFFTFVLVGLIIYVNIEYIANTLLSFDLFSNSRFLNHFISGEMFESPRSKIYDLCEQRIFTMGIDISGLFGDRPFCGSIYPHNFIYEIMMQSGWLLGPIILILYLNIIIYSLKNKRNRQAAIFILCTLLLKFMLSGSYLLSGQFWIATCGLIAISKSKNIITNEHSGNFFNISRA